jgi:hypothetical protein
MFDFKNLLQHIKKLESGNGFWRDAGLCVHDIRLDTGAPLAAGSGDTRIGTSGNPNEVSLEASVAAANFQVEIPLGRDYDNSMYVANQPTGDQARLTFWATGANTTSRTLTVSDVTVTRPGDQANAPTIAAADLEYRIDDAIVTAANFLINTATQAKYEIRFNGLRLAPGDRVHVTIDSANVANAVTIEAIEASYKSNLVATQHGSR